MKPWDEVKRIFGDALDRAPEEREAFVRGACGGNEWLRAQVATLLHRRRSFIATAGALRETREAPGPGAQSESVGPKGRHYNTLTSTAEDGGVAGVQELAKGAVLVERYVLGDRIGAGASGAVHRAKDQLTGQDVAVKILVTDGETDLQALRRETAVLRQARLPGVVELLDDGVDHGWAFIVMKLVEGRPFPAPPADPAVPWEALRDRALRFLEAAGRLHWLGILHRDLKPANVLVDAQGNVTVVDLGIARERDEASPGLEIAGTLPFLSPERLEGLPATIASDLFAAGVMLWEALAGQPLDDCDSIDALRKVRRVPARRVDAVVPGVPKHVADAIARMLDPDPAARPRSVRETLSLLRNGVWDPQHLPLPWVGEDSVVRAIVDAVKTKKPLDLAGPRGCGRTRSLQEAEKRLVAEGYRVLWTRPGTEPFDSLVPVVGEIPQDAGLTLGDLRNWLQSCLHYWLDVHVAVFADDWTSLDRETRAALTRVRESGPLVRVFDQTSRPEDVLVPSDRTENNLRELFHGPDRIFHFREDGARELHRRTAGRPGDCARELLAWSDAGIARWEEGLCRIDRVGIERLETRIIFSLPPARVSAASLSGIARKVQALLEIARTPVHLRTLADALSCSDWVLQTAVDELIDDGVARATGFGSVEAVASLDERPILSTAASSEFHGLLAHALEPLSEARFHHLVLAGRSSEAGEEAVLIARRQMREGQLQRALLTATEGARALNRASGVPDQLVDDLVTLTTDIALGIGSRRALELAHAFPHRLASQTPACVECARVCHAGITALSGDPCRALAELRETPDYGGFDATRRRYTVRAFACRSLPDTVEEERVVRSALQWARGNPAGRGHAYEWLGWLRYRRLQFRRAARLHMKASRMRSDLHARASALLNAASARMEGQEFGSALEAADAAMALAGPRRLAQVEARAIWIERATAYRRGGEMVPDTLLLDAVAHLGIPNLESLILLHEAVLTWRQGRAEAAALLADRARILATANGRAQIAWLATALQAACGGPAAIAAGKDALSRSGEAPETVIGQVQALSLRSLSGLPRHVVKRPSILEVPNSTRLEVLSGHEMNAILRSQYSSRPTPGDSA